MKGAVKVQLKHELTWVTLNENQICWIEPGPEDTAIIHMSNGDVLHISKPSYLAWENDAIIH